MVKQLEPVEISVSQAISLDSVNRAPFAMVLTNPNLPDNPIVYVNRAFERVTGYSREAAVGRNCRFLQGEATDPKHVEALRAALRARREVAVDILNYRADGTPFRNRLMISPLPDDSGGVPYFLGVQVELGDNPADRAPASSTDIALREIQHRVKNHLSMIVGMIRMQSRQAEAGAPFDFQTLARRVETLQLLYEELTEGMLDGRENDARIALGAYLTRVANAIAYLDGRSGIRVNVEADAIDMPFETATRMGLILSEIMTNAMQHAFSGRESGLAEVRVKALSGGAIRLQVTDDGVGLPKGSSWPDGGGLGGSLVQRLVDGLGAELSVGGGSRGTIVTLDVPADDPL